MAVKWLPANLCSRANVCKPFITSSPVSKIRAKVFWPWASDSNLDFTGWLLSFQGTPEQAARHHHSGTHQCQLEQARASLLGRFGRQSGILPLGPSLWGSSRPVVQRHLKDLGQVDSAAVGRLSDLLLAAKAVGDD